MKYALLLLIAIPALANYSADDARSSVNAKDRAADIYGTIKAAAEAGEYSIKVSKHCDDLQYLKKDGYGLIVAGGSEKDNIFYCVVTWHPVNKK